MICSTSTAHSLPGVEGERTVLLRSGAVKVRLRRSSRARRLRLVLVPGVGPELVVPARVRDGAIDGALETLTPWLERALARQQPEALGLARPGVVWHGGEEVRLRLVTAARASGELERRRAGAARSRPRGGRRGPRALVPALGAPRARGLGRGGKRLRWARRRAKLAGARPAHALGLVLGRGGTLSFSWRLLLAPAWVLDDVVCHDSATWRVANHSRAFWALLAEHRPAADPRPWLRAHGGELAAYRAADSIGTP